MRIFFCNDIHISHTWLRKVSSFPVCCSLFQVACNPLKLWALFMFPLILFSECKPLQRYFYSAFSRLIVCWESLQTNRFYNRLWHCRHENHSTVVITVKKSSNQKLNDWKENITLSWKIDMKLSINFGGQIAPYKLLPLQTEKGRTFFSSKILSNFLIHISGQNWVIT